MPSIAETRRLCLLLILPAALLLHGCQLTRPIAVGKEREINVVADEADWFRVGALVRGVLGRRTTIFFEEQIFTVNWVRPEQFADFQARKNLFIIASLRDTAYTLAEKTGADLLRRIMSPASFDSLTRSRMEMLYLRDFWAHDQLVVLAAATEGELLRDLLQTRLENAYDFFDEGLDQRVKDHVYHDGVMKLDRLRRRFGWSMEIPANYELVREDPAAHLYQFARQYPDRSIFVYWENNPRTDMSDTSLVNLRERIAAKYNDGEEVNREYTAVEPAEFAGRSGKRIDGLWENNKLVLGGNFISYCINTADRFYMIDAKLFAPGMEKEPWLRQLGIVLSTFQAQG